MNKLSKEKRDQLILVGAGTLVVVIGLWYGVIKAQQYTLAQTIKKQEEAAKKLAKGQLYLKNSQTIQSNLFSAQQRLRVLEDEMPSGDMFSWIINTMDKFKGTNQVDIVDYQPGRLGRFELMPDFPYTNAATFRVSVQATYHDFGKFLADFENKFPHFMVQNLDLFLPNIPDASKPERISADIDVVALVRPSSSP